MIKQKFASIIFLIMPFLFVWVLLGQVIQSRITIDKLIKVTGIIDTTTEITTHTIRHSDSELRIYLKDTSVYFRYMDVYNYNLFCDKIHRGDTTQIYVRPKWLVPLGLGYRNDIFRMTVNGQTIFDVSQTHKNENGIIIVCIIGIPLFIYLRLFTRRKIHEKEKLQAT